MTRSTVTSARKATAVTHTLRLQMAVLLRVLSTVTAQMELRRQAFLFARQALMLPSKTQSLSTTASSAQLAAIVMDLLMVDWLL